MSIALDLLEILWNTKLSYKGVRTNLVGVPDIWRYGKSSTYRTISRLKNKGYIEEKSGRLQLTKIGKDFFNKNSKLLPKFESSLKKTDPKTMLLMFDIPETRSRERKWLRFHLKKFNYFMIQKSVWVGPGPLPKDFSDYIKSIKLKDCIKIFKLAKSYRKLVT